MILKKVKARMLKKRAQMKVTIIAVLNPMTMMTPSKRFQTQGLTLPTMELHVQYFVKVSKKLPIQCSKQYSVTPFGTMVTATPLALAPILIRHGCYCKSLFSH